MFFSIRILWRDGRRYSAAVIAVAFSHMLLVAQCGLILGVLGTGSYPIENARADIWIATPETAAIVHTRPIPESWLLRLAEQPEVVQVESVLMGMALWHMPNHGDAELCCLVAAELGESSLGIVRTIPPALRDQLTERGTVVVDEGSRQIMHLGDARTGFADVNGQRIKVVGTVRGAQAIDFSFVFCSQETARMIIPVYAAEREKIMFGLARCRTADDVPVVIERMRTLYPEIGIYPQGEFATRIKIYWLLRTKGGNILLCTVLIALIVGGVVTAQTLSGAILASLREYSVLDALGIARARLRQLVLAKAFCIGLIGLLLAQPLLLAMKATLWWFDTPMVIVPASLLAGAALTLIMASASGVYALRSLDRVDPATLLR